MSLILMSILIPLYYQSVSAITNSNLDKRDLNISKEYMAGWELKTEESGQHNEPKLSNIDINIKELKVQDTVVATNIKGSYQKGDVVWVRGASGTGKSTLMKLFVKFREADSIQINGVDIKLWDTKELRNKIDYLSQNQTIIKGTLEDNLFLHRPYDKKIAGFMCKDSLLKSILESKEKKEGLSYEILEGGQNLSGGEKQKISIMRMLYGESEIVILDEIHSNLDKDSSKEIYDRIMKSRAERIIFMIAHDELPAHYANHILNITKE